MDFDVMVIGGGTAGVIAAVQAARAGARTLLVEKTGLLGGTITSAGVAFPGLFHAWGRQVIAGIGWDLVRQCVAQFGGEFPDFTVPVPRHWRHQVRLDPAVYAGLCFEAVEGAGCEMLLHTMIASARRDAGGWTVQLCTKTGLQTHRTRVLVDCTGDANAAALAGAELRVIDEPQPATLLCALAGYDVDTLDLDAINAAFERAVQEGAFEYTDVSWDTCAAHVEYFLTKCGDNANHFFAPGAHTSEGRTQLELRVRRAMARLVRFLREQEGLADLRIVKTAAECGVRETATVVGDATVTVEDYQSGRVWDDAICYSFYPIDLHGLADAGLDCRPLTCPTVPTVPLGALLPKGSEGLIVAGRCLSSDRLANSALRVQATCMATGQAAGALAALSATAGVETREVPLADLRGLLAEHGAIVPTGTANSKRQI